MRSIEKDAFTQMTTALTYILKSAKMKLFRQNRCCILPRFRLRYPYLSDKFCLVYDFCYIWYREKNNLEADRSVKPINCKGCCS